MGVIKYMYFYVLSIYQIPRVKYIFMYVLYLILIIIIYYIIRGFLKRKIEKTKTKLDDKILEGTKGYIKVFVVLLGLSVVSYFFEVDFPKSELVFGLLNAFEIFMIMLILIKLTNVLKRYFVTKLKANKSQKLGLINLIVIFSKIIIVSIGLLIVLSALGIDITPLLASAGILGFAVAMGSQEIVKNFMSGIIVFFDKPFEIGDKIKLEDGTVIFVEEIGIRTSKFKTTDGNLLLIPNGDLLSMKIENMVSKMVATRKVQIIIGLPYGVDVDKAKKLLYKLFKSEKRINEDSIVVIIDSLGDWSVNFKVIGQVNFKDYDRKISSELTEQAYKLFNKEGIGFPFPTYTIEKK